MKTKLSLKIIQILEDYRNTHTYKEIAQIIKREVGVSVHYITVMNWDAIASKAKGWGKKPRPSEIKRLANEPQK